MRWLKADALPLSDRRIRFAAMPRGGQTGDRQTPGSRTSILSHVARYDRSNLEDASTLVLSYRSIGPEVTTLKQLGPKKRLAEVETIFLDHNSLRKFEPDHGVRTLRELYLDHNYLKEIDGANPMLSQLETLSLTSNRLTAMKNMSGFKRLRVLRLGNNRLASLSGLTGGATSNTLDTLVLSHNQIAHQYQLSELANFPMLSVLDIRENPIGTSPEIMKFALLCCPNLRIFNGQKVTDDDVIAASEWGSGSARGRSVNCLIEVIREMETLSRQARERSTTGLLRSDFIAYLSTFDDASACGSAVAADQYVRTSPDILSFQDPEFLCEQDRDIIRKERMLAQWDAKVARDRAEGIYDDTPVEIEQYDEPMYHYDEPEQPQMQSKAMQPSDPSPAADSGRFVPPISQVSETPVEAVYQPELESQQADYPPADSQSALDVHAETRPVEAVQHGAPDSQAKDVAVEDHEEPSEREYAPEELARQSVLVQPEVDQEDVDGQPEGLSWKSPEQEGDKDANAEHMAQYGARIRQQRQDKKGIGILPRRERILNVRYMTNSIRETSKSQNTLLESKVRSLFIQHLREQDS